MVVVVLNIETPRHSTSSSNFAPPLKEKLGIVPIRVWPICVHGSSPFETVTTRRQAGPEDITCVHLLLCPTPKTLFEPPSLAPRPGTRIEQRRGGVC